MAWLQSRSAKTLMASALALCIAPLCVRLEAEPQQAPTTPSAGSRFKGVFEPVNYNQDINLTDVFFTSVDEGWVSGDHATILHTTDGGKTWTAQVGGDPNGNEKPIGQLRFLDAQHGWAVTGDGPQRLLRTMDGKNWEQIGEQPVGSGFIDYEFTSVRHGILLGGNMGGFYVTNDGGRHWQNVIPCRISVTIQGLRQTQDCYPLKLQMLSARFGYAIAGWRSPEAPNATSIVLFRTDDAGEHWNYTVTDVRGGRPDGYFINAEHGVLVFQDKTYITSDGGKNWRALLSGGVITDTADSHLRFADPQAGWSLGDKYPALALSYTTDGGQHWKTFAPLKMPGDPNAKVLSLSFPRRDRAYIVGSHGMVYRFRIVPATYSAANASPGPLMPEFDTTQLKAAADRVHQDIAKLQQQIVAAGSTDTASPAKTSAAAPTQESTPPGTGAFTQDTGTFTSDPNDANFTQGFVQNVDPSPPSAPLQACCGPALQTLQTDLTSFNQAAATNTSQFRSLNMIIAGVQLITNLVNQTRQLRDSFSALKHAPNLQAASTALRQLSTKANFTQQASTGFQDPATWFASNAASGSFVQDTTIPQP